MKSYYKLMIYLKKLLYVISIVNLKRLYADLERESKPFSARVSLKDLHFACFHWLLCVHVPKQPVHIRANEIWRMHKEE